MADKQKPGYKLPWEKDAPAILPPEPKPTKPKPPKKPK